MYRLQRRLGFLGFIDVNRQAIPLDDPPLSVTQRLTAIVVPTKLAVQPTHAVYNLVGRSGLNCVMKGFYSFWQVVRVHELLPTTILKILMGHADIVQKELIGIGVFAIGPRHPDEAWYRVDDLTKLVFAFPNGPLRLSSIINIDFISLVSQEETSGQRPLRLANG